MISFPEELIVAFRARVDDRGLSCSYCGSQKCAMFGMCSQTRNLPLEKKEGFVDLAGQGQHRACVLGRLLLWWMDDAQGGTMRVPGRCVGRCGMTPPSM